MTIEEVTKKVLTATGELYKNKKHLIEEKAHERTIAAHIAGYLQAILKDWDVDPEYNREGEKRKTKEDIDGKVAYPDIIIHRHGPLGPNLAAIEVKGFWNKTDRKDDETKLIKLQQKHNYQFLFRLELNENEFDLIQVTAD